jgi:hypothetical protein
MGGGSSLPYDAEVEWLKSSGTQYIDTLLYGTMDLDFEIVVKPVDSGTQFQNVLGDRYSSTSRRYSLMYDRTSGTRGGYWNCGASNEIQIPKNDRDFDNFVTFKKDGLDAYANGTKIGTFSQQEFTTPNTILLFGMRNNGTISNQFQGYIASCKFSQNGILLRDYVPVRVGQVGYMYDKVSRQLFGNSGTGSFILGPDKT